MVSRDLNFIVTHLEKRIARMEGQLASIGRKEALEDLDWDNSTLMVEWKISKRTAAYYRKKGLGHYKRGGRLYYKPEHRTTFLKQQ